jgi:hypothetical protein
VDCGQTVKLGDYEAAVDALLYDYDPEFRRTISKRRLQEDRSFGAALRRLRKQRGLRRVDFEPVVSAKPIARIEQGNLAGALPACIDAGTCEVRPEKSVGWGKGLPADIGAPMEYSGRCHAKIEACFGFRYPHAR